MTAHVLIYCIEKHPACIAAEKYLREKGVTDIELAYVDRDMELAKEMWARAERRTLPQIFIGEKHIGSFSDMYALDQEGELDKILEAE